MIAAQFATNPEVISLLLHAGADTAPTNTDGKTALVLAGANPHLKGTAAAGGTGAHTSVTRAENGHFFESLTCDTLEKEW